MAETVVVLAISALLIVPLLAILGTTTRLDESQTGRIDARSELDWALSLIAKDIRVGTPSSRPPVGAGMSSTLPLLVIDEGGSEQLIHWRVGESGLERITYDPIDSRELTRSVLVPGVGADEVVAPFTYHNAEGRILDPATVGAESVLSCTTLIGVTLAAPDPDLDITSSIDVALRTRIPGGNGC
jgi:hypothetical protein